MVQELQFHPKRNFGMIQKLWIHAEWNFGMIQEPQLHSSWNFGTIWETQNSGMTQELWIHPEWNFGMILEQQFPPRRNSGMLQGSVTSPFSGLSLWGQGWPCGDPSTGKRRNSSQNPIFPPLWNVCPAPSLFGEFSVFPDPKEDWGEGRGFDLGSRCGFWGIWGSSSPNWAAPSPTGTVEAGGDFWGIFFGTF